MDDDPAAYGDAFADVYDAWYGDLSDVDATVAAIERLGPGRRLLELGVGTGRIALPLAAAGFDVVGVDASQAMLGALRAKEGAEAVTVVLGDMADLASIDGPFDVVLVTFNTLFNLTTEAEQQRCLEGVAGLLADDGMFVVEAFVPSPEPEDLDIGSEERSDGAGGTITTRVVRDPMIQVVTGEHIHRRAGGDASVRSWQIRYLYPEQLDAMAAAAGMARSARWADWDGTDIDPGSARHISIYRPRRPLD